MICAVCLCKAVVVEVGAHAVLGMAKAIPSSPRRGTAKLPRVTVFSQKVNLKSLIAKVHSACLERRPRCSVLDAPHLISPSSPVHGCYLRCTKVAPTKGDQGRGWHFSNRSHPVHHSGVCCCSSSFPPQLPLIRNSFPGLQRALGICCLPALLCSAANGA